MNTYSHPEGGIASFGFTLPGSVVCMAASKDKGWILSKGAFICGSTNLRISGRFAGCCAATYSGEGAFLTKVTLVDDSEKPTGTFWAGGYGGINRHVVEQGKCFMIDNGLFFAAGDKQKIRVGFIGGGTSTCFSGEGLVMILQGPATIYTQNRDPSIFKPPEDPSDGSDPFAQ
jgi:uncharacterized protein (AIM24 family)